MSTRRLELLCAIPLVKSCECTYAGSRTIVRFCCVIDAFVTYHLLKVQSFMSKKMSFRKNVLRIAINDKSDIQISTD